MAILLVNNGFDKGYWWLIMVFQLKMLTSLDGQGSTAHAPRAQVSESLHRHLPETLSDAYSIPSSMAHKSIDLKV